MPTVRAEPLRRAIAEVFSAVGVPEPEAALVADHLVEAELAGVTSHGIMRLPQYLQAIREGRVVPSARLAVLKRTHSAAVLDGNHGFGQVMAHQAMDLALELADGNGVGAATLFHCSHTGRLGSYTEHAARRGRIGLMMVNTGGHGQWVAPFGGSAGRLSTNPISIAIPTGGAFPLVLDMATSAAPEGKVRAMMSAGRAIPEGWVITADGQSTTDPSGLYGPPRGALLPLGGHKGFGLGLMVDALAGALSGAGCCSELAAPLEGVTDGVFLMAIDVEVFCPLAAFQQRVQQLVAHVKSAPLAPGFQAVVVPGELEAMETVRRLAEGIPIGDGVWQSLESVFKETSVTLDLSPGLTKKVEQH